ncbi:MAG TPA: hypothetical protein PK239_01975 [Chitinophagales bacterium]|nr:hypothetical protein [Chitinophagales bacterium]HRK26035.1 hypothetical protein [Chitinophagales bacterium]
MAMLCIALFLIFSSTSVYAQLFCTNNSNYPVWVAVGYNYMPNNPDEIGANVNNVWVTESWIMLKVGETAQLSTHIGYDHTYGTKTNFYYYAYQPTPNGKIWAGNRQLLIDINPPEVDPHVFKTRILFANRIDLYQDRPSLQYAKFRMVPLENPGYYTVVLEQDDPDDGMYYPVMHGDE